MRVYNISYSDGAGGASRAAFRLHRSLLDEGIDSRMLVRVKRSDDPFVVGPMKGSGKLYAYMLGYADRFPLRMQLKPVTLPHSAAWVGGLAATRINGLEDGVVNLHWIGNGTLSIEAIGRLNKPVVWTLHDMWPFCGAEHYPSENGSERWKSGYSRWNRPEGERGVDMDRLVWSRKKNAWKQPFSIVCPSRWMARMAGESALMNGWPITVVPNPLNTRVFKPVSRKAARDALNLPADARLVLFGSSAVLGNPLKGWELLQQALCLAASGDNAIEGVVFGHGKPEHAADPGLKIHWLGRLYDDISLALLYSAADLVVVPSRLDNLPQVGTEAQACGCPVVAFDTGGLADVVEHNKSGYLAKPFDPHDLAKGIAWVMESRERQGELSVSARNRALRLWAPEVVAQQYARVYRKASEAFFSASS
ncbi:hypothetical protein CHL67_01860 [Prosthecochloris sp. GSB1]|uniref:glycosyltransferase n=1 Tax=Prosthecochloris sp. GSB1 TaxID=281093 RepID=UPI000B8CF96D|nr:glycosyltransferase [Prosthecochloris sp. GSB1]ASQ89830.1 hypothetical protein CHL67_01860 [Prosthecochloris sp. GSB1]